MTEGQYESILGNVFPALNDSQLHELYNISRVVEHPDGTRLCNEGALERVFYVILDGTVRVSKSIEGESHFLATKDKGEYFGEMALVLNEPRTADVDAEGRVKVLEIDKDSFDTMLVSNPAILLELNKLTMRQLRDHEEIWLQKLAQSSRDKPGPYRVFVSYAEEDRDIVLNYAKNLLEDGINIWMAELNLRPGSRSWEREVGSALDSSSIMLLFVSPASIESDHVGDEWNYFLDDPDKILIPVIIDECKLPFRLHRIQHLDVTGLDEATALTRIASALRRYHV